jgi:branched-chain amino acid transport system ATP-binding protein
MPAALLRLTAVNKSFGAVPVAKDLSFAVEQGSAVGIIGPNGAGKSTLFNLIAGNLRASSGRIEFLGRDVTRVSAMQRCIMGIGRSFQIPQPFEKLTVLENLLVASAFGAGKKKHDAPACARILDKTQLLHKANTLAGALSLLDRKRLELARALATEPKLLLLDEIAGGLTEAECEVLLQTIGEVRAQGVTLIWVEHILHALTRAVGRILVLNFGELIADGTPAQVMSSQAVQEIYLGLEA